MIWFTSDFHWNHNKDFIYKERGFSSVEEMNKAIINNFNAVVKEDDDTYILGDIIMGADAAQVIEYLEKLNGHLHIITGNHDAQTKIEFYKQAKNVVEITPAKFLNIKKYHFYLSHFPTLVGNNEDSRDLKKVMINICGHAHCKNRFEDMDKSLIYHVEVDAHDCKPVSIDDILTDIKYFISLDKNTQTDINKGEK